MNSFLTSFLLLVSCIVFGQNNGSIKGTVTDSSMNDEPVLFANVQLKGSDFETETNFHGNFEIKDLEPGDYTVVINYVGYNTEEISVKVTEDGLSKINISLKSLQISSAAFVMADDISVLDESDITVVNDYPNK